MPNPSPQNLMPVSQFVSQANSSTGIRLGLVGLGYCDRPVMPVDSSEIGEVSFPTGLCGLSGPAKTGRYLVGVQRERNESVDSGSDSIRISNRKDRQKAYSQPLLKAPNPSRIVGFAEDVRHRCATPDEQVMDRDAEGVAGGSDAI